MNEEKSSSPVDFVVQSILDEDRIDCRYYDPVYFNTISELEKLSKSNGFELAPLAQLLADGKRSLTGGATPLGATYLEVGIPFIRSQNVKETGIELSETVFIAKTLHEGKFKRSQLKPLDVLLTITGAIYGISSVVPEGIGQANINQHIVKIEVNKNEILPEFLSLFLNSNFGKKQTDRAVTGGTRPALDYPSIRNLKILWPPIPLQENIVKEVKGIHDEARRIYDQIAKLEASYDSVILDRLAVAIPEEPKLKTFLSVPDKDRLEVKWYYPHYNKVIAQLSSMKSRRIGQFPHDLRYGASLYSDYAGDIPFLRIENIKRDYIDLSDLQYVSSSVHKNEVANLHLKENDILIARSGSVGLCSHVPSGFEKYVFGSYIIRLRLQTNEIVPQYLSTYLNSILGRMQFEHMKTGSLQYNINVPQIREIAVIEPDKAVQEDVASEAFQIRDQVANLRKMYEEKLSEAKAKFIHNLTAGP